MIEFNKKFADLIAKEDKQGGRDWITVLDNERRYTEPGPERSIVLKRQIRLLRDWIEDCDRC